MAAATELDIGNEALGLISASPLRAIDDDTPNGERIKRIYRPQVRDFLLSQHRWVFAAGLVELAERYDVANPPLPHSYSLPADLVGTVHAFRPGADLRSPTLSVHQLGDAVCADYAPVWAEYTRAVPERLWPSTFRSLVVHYLASMLARANQNRGLAKELQDQALGADFAQGIEGGLLLLAKREDGKSAPERQAFDVYEPGVLVEARYGGGGPWGGRARFYGPGSSPWLLPGES